MSWLGADVTVKGSKKNVAKARKLSPRSKLTFESLPNRKVVFLSLTEIATFEHLEHAGPFQS